MEKTILLVDDHAVVRQGLKSLLGQWGYRVVAEADSGESAILLNQEHKPNLIIMDLDMPGMGGLEALQRIILRQKNTKIIVYSMHDDNIYALRAMQAGARGYVVKSDEINILLNAVEKVFQGERFIGRKIAEHLAIDLMNQNNKPLEKLAPREFEVFRQLAVGNSLEVIAESLNISYKTVANIQTTIRRKLDVKTTASLVHLAIQLGVTQSKSSANL
ncbi:MAG: response regulator transcription factor [Methylotenera sp.]|nr:response regulator transcription factor [Methylotenera sp.]MDD4926792.1 response regulator transcription factor [Methylotenera sp.]NOS95111.1 response regulator transcription factor [Methylotenera sp.]NOU40749.1 response regulator transcription factor [Methylotenera sp.]